MSHLLLRLRALGLLFAAPVLALLTPPPGTALAGVTDPTATTALATDLTAPLVGVVALLAWACTGWLTVAVLVTGASRLPGSAGRSARAASRRVAPGALTALVRVAVGLAVTTTALAGPTAHAAEPTPAPGSVVTSGPSLDWPMTVTGGDPAPETVRPRPGAVPSVPATATRAPAAAVPANAPASGAPVVVQPGDSLWTIAAHALGAGATARQVARSWPSWWGANRAVLGEDPDLIHPGTRLVPPAP